MRYKTPAAFKASLEERIRTVAAARNVPMNTLRLKLVMERLLARLFAAPGPPWLLKGGYAMELRYRPRARTTRDIDLTIGSADASQSLPARLAIARDQLQAAAGIDLGDHLTFIIGAAEQELTGAPLGGARFPCEATLAGRHYARFHIDLGLGDAAIGEPEKLIGDRLLDFADIPPAVVLALPRAQQFAEKVHAYTYPWVGRANTRTKDLVDLVLLIRAGLPADDPLRTAICATFEHRGSHPVPAALAPPPAFWSQDYAAMATEAILKDTSMDAGFVAIASFWDALQIA